MLLRSRSMPSHLQMLLLELQCYNFEMVKKPSEEYLPALPDLNLGEPISVSIKTMTTRASRQKPTRQGPHVRVNFDGGLGTVGWVASDISGTPHHAFGRGASVEFHTHSIEEVEAARQAMDFLASETGHTWLAAQEGLLHVLLVGDSDLVIKFL